MKIPLLGIDMARITFNWYCSSCKKPIDPTIMTKVTVLINVEPNGIFITLGCPHCNHQVRYRIGARA